MKDGIKVANDSPRNGRGWGKASEQVPEITTLNGLSGGMHRRDDIGAARAVVIDRKRKVVQGFIVKGDGVG